MTSPINLHIFPNCGLKIIPKLDEDDDWKRISRSIKSKRSPAATVNFGQSMTGAKGKQVLSYIIEDIETQGFPISHSKPRKKGIAGAMSRDFVGVMSPLSPLSLPKQKKRLAKIDERATRYAFIHPPRGLAKALDWEEILQIWKNLKEHDKEVNDNDQSEESEHDDSYRKYNTSSDSNGTLSSSHSLKRMRTFGYRFARKKTSLDRESSKPLIGGLPFATLSRKWALACFSLLGAFVYFEDGEVLSVNALCLSKLGTEGGLRMSGPFKTPLETIHALEMLNRFEVIPLDHFHEYGFVAKAWLCPKEQGSPHGSLVFLREDNTALTYHIKSGADALRSGSRSILADLIDPHVNDIKMILGQSFVTKYVACSDIESMEETCLKHFPSWSPLHYSCRFRANDIQLIQNLKEEHFDKVAKFDRFGRSTLHLLCENTNVTVEAIRELLNNDDRSITKKLLHKKTKCYKRQPLHVAVNSNVSIEVIDELLKTSKDMRICLEKTAEGRLPIHIAIENMADKNVIESLLKADISKQSIYEKYIGMLPLHIACWNGHHDAVKLLLKYDGEGNSLHKSVSTAMYLKFKSKKDYLTFNTNGEALVVSNKKNMSKRRLHHDTPQEDFKVRALHIALLKCSDENSANITKLLLKEEYWDMNSEEGEVTVTMKDSAGRNPLMLACMQNVDEDIIKLLINLDQTKNTAAEFDNLDNSALHYLCEHELISESVVQLLLDAEDEFYCNFRANKDLDSLPINKKSTSTLNNELMTPLKLAIRAGAPTSVLKLLLQPGRIDLKEFDEQTIHQLSLRIKDSKILQEIINHKLSERHPCFNLLMSLLWKVSVFIFFAVETDEFLTGKSVFSNAEGIQVFELGIPVLVFYLVIELVKESNEIIALGAGYLLSKKNWLDMLRISLLIIAVDAFMQRKTINNTDFGSKAEILTLAGFLLGFDIIIAFRSTFLPFAKFAGGLAAIFSTLIPFFIVSIVFLICFTIAFRLDALQTGEDLNVTYDNLNELSPEDLCRLSFFRCLKMVLRAFFTGEFESNSLLYLAFGLLVILILLTIVIAIVSDAWDSVETKASQYYWESRITFLHDVQLSIFESSRKSQIRQKIVNFGNKISKWVDEFGYVAIFQEEERFSWTRDSPYNQVSHIHQYYEPYEYFHPDVAKVIKAAHSPGSEVYWINQKEEGWRKKKSLTIATIRWIAYFIAYSMLILLGLVTGGFFWPTRFRRFFLSYGYESRDTKSDKSKDQLNKETSSSSHAGKVGKNETMSKKSKLQILDDCFIEMMESSPEIAKNLDTISKLGLIVDKLGVDRKDIQSEK